MKTLRLPSILAITITAATACRSAPTAIAPIAQPGAPPRAVPEGYVRLEGPSACANDVCKLQNVREVDAAGVHRIGVIVHDLDATIAIETSAGWFLEPHRERVPRMSSHHSPQSRSYDLAATRVEEDVLILRLVDSLRVGYPGQLGAGSSDKSWYDRRCSVIDAAVYCAAPSKIASERCTYRLTPPVLGPPSADPTTIGPQLERTCEGGPPPS